MVVIRITQVVVADGHKSKAHNARKNWDWPPWSLETSDRRTQVVAKAGFIVLLYCTTFSTALSIHVYNFYMLYARYID